MHGSGDLVSALARHDLVTSTRQNTCFAGGRPPTTFRLAGSTANTTGVMVQTYERAGKPEYGPVDA